jgi:hypothetical protein
MKFRIVIEQRIRGEDLEFAGRILTLRDEDWHICGVFTVSQPEWEILARLFYGAGVEIHEIPPAIPEAVPA